MNWVKTFGPKNQKLFTHAIGDLSFTDPIPV